MKRGILLSMVMLIITSNAIAEVITDTTAFRVSAKQRVLLGGAIFMGSAILHAVLRHQDPDISTNQSGELEIEKTVYMKTPEIMDIGFTGLEGVGLLIMADGFRDLARVEPAKKGKHRKVNQPGIRYYPKE